MKFSLSILVFACLHGGGTKAESTECPEQPKLSLEFIRIGEDAIYLQTGHTGPACLWTGGEFDDLPVGHEMNCFGQGVRHPVNTTEFCVELRSHDVDVDCASSTASKACATVNAYSASPSLAPSSSPTEAPTVSLAPSYSPSNTPSVQPSLSPYPSVAPTGMPTSSPTNAPSVSSAPTAEPVFTMASSIQISLSGVTVQLNEKGKKAIERKTLEYLVTASDSTTDGHLVLFEYVRVTDQFIDANTPGRKLSTNTLYVVLDVAGFVHYHKHKNFEFSSFVSDFFKNQTVVDDLYEDIETDLSIYGVRHKGTSHEEGPKAGLISSLVTMSIFLGGLTTLYLRRKRREKMGSGTILPSRRKIIVEIEDQISVKPTASQESESIAGNSHDDTEAPHLGGYPINHSYKSKRHLKVDGRNRTSGQKAHLQFNEDQENLTARSHRTLQTLFLCAESNIEIPVTPVTNYDMSRISPRGLESEADDESVPSPARSDRAFYPGNQGRSSPQRDLINIEGDRAKGFLRFGNKLSQARKSGMSDATVLLSSYGRAPSSSGTYN